MAWRPPLAIGLLIVLGLTACRAEEEAGAADPALLQSLHTGADRCAFTTSAQVACAERLSGDGCSVAVDGVSIPGFCRVPPTRFAELVCVPPAPVAGVVFDPSCGSPPPSATEVERRLDALEAEITDG